MNYTVRPQAWLDLEETMTYLRDAANEATAIRFWQRTQETFEWLARQPGAGRLRPDLKPAGLRSWRVEGFEKWLVFYLRVGTEVQIIRVRHGLMDLPKIFVGDENV